MALQRLPDNEDAHLIVELLYQPFAEQTQDEQGVWHTKPIDAKLSGNLFVSAMLLLRSLIIDVGVAEEPSVGVAVRVAAARAVASASRRGTIVGNLSLQVFRAPDLRPAYPI